jgi:hypothetical protein
VKSFLLPDRVKEARALGYREGMTDMRERLARDFATFAASHPDPIVSDELWAFCHHIRTKETS